LKLSDLNNLKFETVGSWPLPVRIGAILMACLGLTLLSYVMVLSDLQDQVGAAREEETALKQAYEAKQVKAANLPALKVQLAEIKDTFGDLLKRLPNKTEVAALLVDISQQGLGAGNDGFHAGFNQGGRLLDGMQLVHAEVSCQPKMALMSLSATILLSNSKSP